MYKLPKERELKFITLQDLTVSTKEYPRNVTLAINHKGEIHLLGNLEHNTRIAIDKENGKQLIELIKLIIK